MVEHESVPGEPSARTQSRRDPFEGAAPVGPRRQVEQRPERAVDECRRLVECELAHVAFMQLELDPRLGSMGPRLLEHRRRSVDSDHRVGRSQARQGSRPVRSRSQARPVVHLLRGRGRRRTRRPPSCAPPTRRSAERTPRPSSSADPGRLGPTAVGGSKSSAAASAASAPLRSLKTARSSFFPSKSSLSSARSTASCGSPLRRVPTPVRLHSSTISETRP